MHLDTRKLDFVCMQTKKGTEQPAHWGSLIITFAIHFLECKMTTLATHKI